jgi:hypothetical protein
MFVVPVEFRAGSRSVRCTIKSLFLGFFFSGTYRFFSYIRAGIPESLVKIVQSRKQSRETMRLRGKKKNRQAKKLGIDV